MANVITVLFSLLKKRNYPSGNPNANDANKVGKSVKKGHEKGRIISMKIFPLVHT